MKTTPGSKVYLRLPGLPRQWYIIAFVGPKSLRLKRNDGTTIDVPRNKVRFQLVLSASPRIRVISTPMGGKPGGR